MYVVEHQGSLQLRDPLNLKALYVALPAGRSLPAAIQGARQADETHYWLDVAHLKNLGPRDEGWQANFDKVIAYAGQKGWLSGDGLSVRAHVEFASASDGKG